MWRRDTYWPLGRQILSCSGQGLAAAEGATGESNSEHEINLELSSCEERGEGLGGGEGAICRGRGGVALSLEAALRICCSFVIRNNYAPRHVRSESRRRCMNARVLLVDRGR